MSKIHNDADPVIPKLEEATDPTREKEASETSVEQGLRLEVRRVRTGVRSGFGKDGKFKRRPGP